MVVKNEKIRGSCHCGSVNWEFNLPIKTVVMCHCSMCRKGHGSDYSTYIIVPQKQFLISKGENSYTTYKVTAISRKNFCSKCGSPTHLINGKHFPNDIVLPLGLVENYMDELAPQIQVYTPKKAKWTYIHDDIPIFS